jgi:hypothetical protein
MHVYARFILISLALLCFAVGAVRAEDGTQRGRQTHVMHMQGECRISKDQAGQFDRAQVEPTIAMRMSYTPTFLFRASSLGPRVACSVRIKNPSEQRLYCRIGIALFDEQGSLIGTTAGGRGYAAGFDGPGVPTDVEGPGDEILKARRYQIVIYESDGPIDDRVFPQGSEETPVNKTFATSLSGLPPTVRVGNGYASYHYAGEIGFDKSEKDEPAFLEFEPESTRFRAQVWLNRFIRAEKILRDGKSVETGETQVNDSVSIVPETVPFAAHSDWSFHAVLLDQHGRLVAASKSNTSADFIAPLDRLQRGRRLQIRLYDTSVQAKNGSEFE